MKWYPFWKAWYFSREQRFGIIFMISIILLITLIKGPVFNYFAQQKEKKYTVQNQEKWSQLQAQIDSSKALAQKEKDSLKSNSYAKYPSKEEKYLKEKIPKETKAIVLEINQATAADFKRLKGIGEVLSQRIVSYRTRLGGFYKTEQIQEVYGISDSLFQAIQKQLKIKKQPPKQLHLNQASLEELQVHPYISKTLAKQVIGYREKVKPFESIEEVKKLYAINDSLYNKLYPYLTIY